MHFLNGRKSYLYIDKGIKTGNEELLIRTLEGKKYEGRVKRMPDKVSLPHGLHDQYVPNPSVNLLLLETLKLSPGKLYESHTTENTPGVKGEGRNDTLFLFLASIRCTVCFSPV